MGYFMNLGWFSTNVLKVLSRVTTMLRKIPRLDMESQVIVLALFISLQFGGASAEDWSWRTEKVDTDASFTSLAVDHDGNVHVSYVNNGMVKYAFRPVGTSKWFNTTVDQGNSFTNIAVDGADNPYICYT